MTTLAGTTIERRAFRPHEFAAALGISRTTVYRWMADGTIRTVRVGEVRLIPATEADRLLAVRAR